MFLNTGTHTVDMDTPEVDIVVDTREKYKQVFVEALARSGASVIVEKLPVGDFIVNGHTDKDAILVERKTASDFLGSIEGVKDKATGVWREGRIWDQVRRMRETGLRSYILIEGNIYNRKLSTYRRKGFDKHRIWGCLEGLRELGVRIHFVKNKAETVEWLTYLSSRQKRPKKLYSLRVSAPHTMTMEQKQMYLLQGFPGVGPKTSKAILEHYGCLESALRDVRNWSSIRGVGSRTALEAEKLLKHRWGKP